MHGVQLRAEEHKLIGISLDQVSNLMPDRAPLHTHTAHLQFGLISYRIIYYVFDYLSLRCDPGIKQMNQMVMRAQSSAEIRIYVPDTVSESLFDKRST